MLSGGLPLISKKVRRWGCHPHAATGIQNANNIQKAHLTLGLIKDGGGLFSNAQIGNEKHQRAPKKAPRSPGR